MANYTYVEPFSPAFGSGFQDRFAHLCGLTAAQLKAKNLYPGQFVYHQATRMQVVLNKTGSALAKGDAVVANIGGAERIGNLTANSTKAVLETDDTFVSGELVGTTDRPSFVFVTAGTGIHQFAPVIGNSADAGASTLTVAKYDSSLNKDAVDSPMALDTAPDATSDYSVVCPWEVIQATSASIEVIGAAVAAIGDDQYGLITIGGPGPLKLVGTTDPVIVGEGIVPSATAGTAKGPTAAGMTALEASLVFATGIYAFSGAAAANIVWFRAEKFNPVPPMDTR